MAEIKQVSDGQNVLSTQWQKLANHDYIPFRYASGNEQKKRVG